MSYSAESGDRTAAFRRLADVPTILTPGISMHLLATGDLTDEAFGLFERHMGPRAGGPEPHVHRTFSESFYVLDGTVRFYDGEQWVEGGRGDFLHVPKGGIHAFKNDADADAAMLILFAPGSARERFFQEAAEIRNSGRELTPEEWTAFYARHDQYMV